MKKYLAILLGALFLGNQDLQSYVVHGNAGINVGFVDVNKNKKTINGATLGFSSTTPFMVGASAELNCKTHQKISFGGYADVDWLNKKSGYSVNNISSEAVKEITAATLLTTEDISVLTSLANNKKLLSAKMRAHFGIGLHCIYHCSDAVSLQLGCGYGHINKSYRKSTLTEKSAEITSLKKGTAANIAQAWTAFDARKIRKLKKSGFEIKGLAAVNMTKDFGANVAVSYITGVKAWRACVGVRANF